MGRVVARAEALAKVKAEEAEEKAKAKEKPKAEKKAEAKAEAKAEKAPAPKAEATKPEPKAEAKKAKQSYFWANPGAGSWVGRRPAPMALHVRRRSGPAGGSVCVLRSRCCSRTTRTTP